MMRLRKFKLGGEASVLHPQAATRRGFLFAVVAALILPARGFAGAGAFQVNEREPAMSDAEVERLRQMAPEPVERLVAFISFLDERTRAIEKLDSGLRHPGREEDIRDLMNQVASISDDLDDNLDDYSRGHRDVRKVLPRLIAATERWATMLRTPADDARYDVARKLALTSLGDVKDSAQKMVEEQKIYFKSHPPSKENRGANSGG